MLFDPKVTYKWWNRLLDDEVAMNKWLLKLQVTEADGYAGNFEVNAHWNPTGIRKVETFLIQTARDELRHSNLLVDLLAERGLPPLADQTPQSIYWDRMEAAANTLEDMLAVFYLGEALASERFQIISECKSTPSDIQYFIHSALPDEEMHARGYKTLAGDEAIERMTAVHHETMKLVITNK